MGGRVALRVAGAPAVVGVCLLAPWIKNEPVEQLAAELVVDVGQSAARALGGAGVPVPEVQGEHGGVLLLGHVGDSRAYRLRAEGEPLPDWHYLNSGDRESVHAAGQSTRGWTVSENDVGDLEHHLTDRTL